MKTTAIAEKKKLVVSEEMCVTVYVWNPEVDSYGHASLGTKNCYVSAWPQKFDERRQGRPVYFVTTLTEDESSESLLSVPHKPEHITRLYSLDVAEIEKKFASIQSESPLFSVRKKNLIHLAERDKDVDALVNTLPEYLNCAALVYRLLLAGGAHKLITRDQDFILRHIEEMQSVQMEAQNTAEQAKSLKQRSVEYCEHFEERYEKIKNIFDDFHRLVDSLVDRRISVPRLVATKIYEEKIYATPHFFLNVAKSEIHERGSKPETLEFPSSSVRPKIFTSEAKFYLNQKLIVLAQVIPLSHIVTAGEIGDYVNQIFAEEHCVFHDNITVFFERLRCIINFLKEFVIYFSISAEEDQAKSALQDSWKSLFDSIRDNHINLSNQSIANYFRRLQFQGKVTLTTEVHHSHSCEELGVMQDDIEIGLVKSLKDYDAFFWNVVYNIVFSEIEYVLECKRHDIAELMLDAERCMCRFTRSLEALRVKAAEFFKYVTPRTVLDFVEKLKKTEAEIYELVPATGCSSSFFSQVQTETPDATHESKKDDKKSEKSSSCVML